MLTVDDLFKLHDELCGAGKAIMESKNHDYRGGSGDPLANFRGSKTFDIEPIVGILLRVQDKMMRIKTFAEKGQLQVKGEGVKDALIDVINYMVLIGGFIKEQALTNSPTVDKGAQWAQAEIEKILKQTGRQYSVNLIDKATNTACRIQKCIADNGPKFLAAAEKLYGEPSENSLFKSLCDIPAVSRGEAPDLGDEAHPEI